MKRDRCPKCGCVEYTKQGKEKTKFKGSDMLILQERRKCKKCGCKYTVSPKERNYPICPFCAHSGTSKAGFSKFGVQVYKCNSCGRTFQGLAEGCHSEQISSSITPISESQEYIIKSYFNNGFSVPYIEKFTHINQKQINDILKYYETNTQRPSGLDRAICCYILERNGVFHHEIAENFCIPNKKVTQHIEFLIKECNYKITYSHKSGYRISL